MDNAISRVAFATENSVKFQTLTETYFGKNNLFF